MAAWAQATEAILEGVAATYGGSITYEELAQQLFERTGYRTRMMLGHWIGQVLGPVQAATLTEGKPPLSALVVRAGTGGVGRDTSTTSTLRASARSPSGSMPPPPTASRATAAYCDHVPEDAAPQMTSLFIAKQTSLHIAERTSRKKPAPRCTQDLPYSQHGVSRQRTLRLLRLMAF